MAGFRSVLAVIQNADEAQDVLSKAKFLGAVDDGEAAVQAVRVVYEGVADLNIRQIDASTELKTFILSAEETYLQDAIDGSGVVIPGMNSVTVWNKRPWQGVVHSAEAMDADLIIKSSSRSSGIGNALRTPDDWNLLRHAPAPVLLTHSASWAIRPRILVALDLFDDAHAQLNEDIFRAAWNVCSMLQGELHILGVYPLLAPWISHGNNVQSYQSMKSAIESDMRAKIAGLAEDFTIDSYHAHTVEGPTASAIRSTLRAIDGQLLVLGTQARSGVEGLLLGNTAETVLHEIDCDLMVVPGR